jgi:hypothetical protein
MSEEDAIIEQLESKDHNISDIGKALEHAIELIYDEFGLDIDYKITNQRIYEALKPHIARYFNLYGIGRFSDNLIHALIAYDIDVTEEFKKRYMYVIGSGYYGNATNRRILLCVKPEQLDETTFVTVMQKFLFARGPYIRYIPAVANILWGFKKHARYQQFVVRLYFLLLRLLRKEATGLELAIIEQVLPMFYSEIKRKPMFTAGRYVRKIIKKLFYQATNGGTELIRTNAMKTCLTLERSGISLKVLKGRLVFGDLTTLPLKLLKNKVFVDVDIIV